MPIEPWWETNPATTPRQGLGMVSPELPRRDIAIGIEQADRGELAPFDPHATLERIRSLQAPTAGQS